jgi:hypothetical protein
MLKNWLINVHFEEGSGPPSVVSDDLFQNVGQTICERRRFTILEVSFEFPQLLRTLLYNIITG